MVKNSVTKKELIDVLTLKMGTDRRQATAAVENVVDTIVRAVHKGDSVTITGFGVFEQRRRAGRIARNPRTGETVRVKPTSVPAFRPGARFKALVSGEESVPAEGSVGRRAGRVRGAKTAAKKAVKKTAAKKAVKKTAAKKAVKKTAAKKAVKKTAAKKAVKKTAAKKAVKKTAAKKAVKKTAAKKAVKKTAAKKAVKKTAVRRAVRGGI
ncbi:HU family DNA-binding protein [Mycobacterium intracellulare]|uniref:HU family DNA-binding protein n=1 Tax=Mycobacterium intracellulare TaxID=1767 RepID=UPI0022785C32|nr:HU family DNA-binding protein [Mycobacterium intracellulare]